MGSGIAKNILKAGFELTVYNRDPQKTQPFINTDARIASTPADAVEGADAIISIVGDNEASRSVWLGEHGILSGNPKPGAIAIESTTVSRDWVETLGQYCLDVGLQFLDCPVTGGPTGAENGQLTILIGGEKKTLLQAETLLKSFSKQTYHFGPIGTGSAYKLIVNSIGATHIAVLAEAMLVAEKAGLDLQTVAQALSTGSVASRATSTNANKMASNSHLDVAFAAKWRSKDVGYGTEMAKALECETPIMKHAANVFKQTVVSGYGEENESAVLRILKS